MSIPILAGPSYPHATYANVVAFTVKEGSSLLDTLEQLRRYIRDVLVPHVDDQLGGVAGNWNGAVDRLTAIVTAQLNQAAEDTTEQLKENATNNAAQHASNLAAVQAAINKVINLSITVTDPVIQGVLSNLTGEARKLLDSLYASKSVLDARDYITVGNIFDLQAMVRAAEATGKTIYIPGGLALTPSTVNITCNNLTPSFTYRFKGDTKGSRIKLPTGMVSGDFVLRGNQKATGEPFDYGLVSPPSFVFEDLVIDGAASPQGSFFDCYNRSISAARVQFDTLKWGFRNDGYCDLNRLEQIKSNAITAGGWTYQQRANGDGLIISGFFAYGSPGISLRACQGAHISGVISGWHEFVTSDVTLTQSHIEGDGTETANPLIRVRNSRVSIPDGRLYTMGAATEAGTQRPAIEIDDEVTNLRSGSILTLGRNLVFSSRLDAPLGKYTARQGIALNLKSTSPLTRVRFEGSTQNIYYHSDVTGPSVFEEVAPRITSALATQQTLFDANPALITGQVDLKYINGAWELSPLGPSSGIRTFRKSTVEFYNIAIPFSQAGVGSALPLGLYYYRAWTRNTEGQTIAAGPEFSVNTTVALPLSRLLFSGTTAPTTIVLLRGTAPGVYTDWIEITTPAESLIVYDQGGFIAGQEWRRSGVPAIPTVNDTRDGYVLRGTNRKVVSGNGAPVTGTWAVGDRCENQTPVAGGADGWVCVAAGTPGMWKARGNLSA